MAIHMGQAPILSCSDILLEILMYLQPGRRSPEEKPQAQRKRHALRKTLFACSLSCRTLSNVALDVLWRALDDIRPPLRLLATDTDGQIQPQITLKTHITPETWSKFQSYATRIREVGFSLQSDQVHPSVWTFLGIKCQSSPLLSRLYVLDVGEVSLCNLSPPILLLSPCLRSLTLRFMIGQDPTNEVTLLILEHVAKTAPHISHFHILGYPYLAGEHLSTLKNFSRLTELSISPWLPLDGSTLLQLSESNSQDALTASICDVDRTDIDLQSLNDSFPSLRKLTVRGSMQDLAQFFLSYHLPALDEVIFQIIDVGHFDLEEFRHQLALICQHPCLPASLTRIGCEFCCGIPGRRQDTLGSYLEPLLSVSQVQHCRFTFHYALPSICDEDLVQLGDAWANLQRLEIEYVHQAHSRPPSRLSAHMQRPTLFGLTELVRRCPNLNYVHFPELDASSLPDEHTVAGVRHAIQEISFDSVRYATPSAAKPCAVAAILNIAFPALNVSKSMPTPTPNPTAISHRGAHRRSSSNPKPQDSEWGKVIMFVYAMQLGRRHCLASISACKTDLAMLIDSGPGGKLDLDLDLSSEDSKPEALGSDMGESESEGDSSDPYSRQGFYVEDSPSSDDILP